MPCQRYFSHVELSLNEKQKDKKTGIDEIMAPNLALVSSESRSFLPKANDGCANPQESFSKRAHHSIGRKYMPGLMTLGHMVNQKWS